jgi:hypothetical protein
MKTHKWTKKVPYTSAPTIKTPTPVPTPDAIQQRAHQLFLARGNAPGSELMDWLQAERELREERAQALKK